MAISAVVRPPTARSVSAMAEAGVSAGWQHMKSSTSVSSGSSPGSSYERGRDAPSAGLRRRARLAARGARSRCARDRSCAAARPGSASRADCRARRRAATARRPRSAPPAPRLRRPRNRREAPHDGAEHLRRELAQQVLDLRIERRARSLDVGRCAHHLAHLDRHVERRAAGPGAAEASAAICVGALGLSTSTIQ